MDARGPAARPAGTTRRRGRQDRRRTVATETDRSGPAAVCPIRGAARPTAPGHARVGPYRPAASLPPQAAPFRRRPPNSTSVIRRIRPPEAASKRRVSASARNHAHIAGMPRSETANGGDLAQVGAPDAPALMGHQDVPPPEFPGIRRIRGIAVACGPARREADDAVRLLLGHREAGGGALQEAPPGRLRQGRPPSG